MAIDSALQSQLSLLGEKLGRRGFTEKTLDAYYEGDTPLPDVIVRAKVTRAYLMLMGMATAPWGSLVIDSVHDRLECIGIESDDKATDDALWTWWQESQLDAESKLLHKSSLISGRSFGLVWPSPETGVPEVSFDNSSQMIVMYEEGSRRNRTAAMRYWTDTLSGKDMATLYHKDAIYKFQAEKDSYFGGLGEVQWEPRDGEEFVTPNPFNVVPVVEFPVNRRLKPGPWGHARGEYEHVTSLIDRINLLVFLGLIVAFWQGFPVRAVIGDAILRDDDGNPLPPFEIGADQVIQLENPEARLDQFQPADRSILSIYNELDQLAALTKTPITYFPTSGGVSNVSGDSLLALESALISKIPQHKATLGNAWLDLLTIAGRMLDTPVDLSPRAVMKWTDHENRTLSERADAAVKLANVLPQTMLAEYVLNLTAEQMDKIRAEQASNTLNQLIVGAAQPAAPQPPVAQPAQPVQQMTEAMKTLNAQ